MDLFTQKANSIIKKLNEERVIYSHTSEVAAPEAPEDAEQPITPGQLNVIKAASHLPDDPNDPNVAKIKKMKKNLVAAAQSILTNISKQATPKTTTPTFGTM